MPNWGFPVLTSYLRSHHPKSTGEGSALGTGCCCNNPSPLSLGGGGVAPLGAVTEKPPACPLLGQISPKVHPQVPCRGGQRAREHPLLMTRAEDTQRRAKKKRMRKRVPGEIKQRVYPQGHTEKNFNERNNCRLAGTDITAPFSAVSDRTCSPHGSTPAQHEGHGNEATAPSALGRTLRDFPLQKTRPGAWCWPWACQGSRRATRSPTCCHTPPAHMASWFPLFIFLHEKIINGKRCLEHGERCIGARLAPVTLGTWGGCWGTPGWLVGLGAGAPALHRHHFSLAVLRVQNKPLRNTERQLCSQKHTLKGKHVHFKASAPRAYFMRILWENPPRPRQGGGCRPHTQPEFHSPGSGTP